MTHGLTGLGLVGEVKAGKLFQGRENQRMMHRPRKVEEAGGQCGISGRS